MTSDTYKPVPPDMALKVQNLYRKNLSLHFIPAGQPVPKGAQPYWGFWEQLPAPIEKPSTITWECVNEYCLIYIDNKKRKHHPDLDRLYPRRLS